MTIVYTCQLVKANSNTPFDLTGGCPGLGFGLAILLFKSNAYARFLAGVSMKRVAPQEIKMRIGVKIKKR
jgi:hypothetical protein